MVLRSFSSSTVETLERALAAYFGRRFCRLTNRGTTALTAALRSLELPPASPVVFPAAMCSIPVLSASFAGLEPVFADVSLTDGNFDLESLEALLGKTPGPGAVIPIHMFGKPEAWDALEALCGRRGWTLIEDCALSMGASYRGRRVGGFGRLSCLSFVRKMVPLEMGGAVLTDDPVLFGRVVDYVARLPVERPSESDVSRVMREFHRVTAEAARGGWASTGFLDSYREPFRQRLLTGTTEADWEHSILLKELERLEENLRARQARAEVYEGVLSQGQMVPLDRTGSSLFAFPVRLKEVAAEDFLRFAEGKGLSFKRIAYPDIHKIFDGGRRQADGAFRNAGVLEREVVGMPVDEAQPVSSYWGYAQSFVDAFREYLAAGRPRADVTGELEMRMSR